MLSVVCSLVLPATLSTLPAAYELDFRPLPAANNGQAYKFTVTIEFASGESFEVPPITIGQVGGPKLAATFVAGQFTDPACKWKRNEDLIFTVYSFGKDAVKKVTVTGKGPKPAVRRVLLLPSDKKPEKK